MRSAPPIPKTLLRVTLGYAALWLLTLLAAQTGQWLPAWLQAIVYSASLPLGALWINWLRTPNWRDRRTQAVVFSALYPVWSHLLVFWTGLLGLREVQDSLSPVAMGGLFLLGLGWVIWALERASRRIEQGRIDSLVRTGPALVTNPSHAVDEQRAERRIWNPLDPQAWYYGRGSRKLKQSTLVLLTYAAAFWLAVLAVSQIGGCGQESVEMPAGGGVQKTVSQKVRIQKVVRKKYVLNRFSHIKFEVPPIDEVKLQLQEVTAHQYQIGYGEGTGGPGFGGKGDFKIRFFRLEYDGGDWDLNHGPGGDMNMLFEHSVLTGHKVVEKTESRRISQLAGFEPEKSPPFVFLTGQKSLSVSNNEVKVLREYLVDQHGMLFASSGSGHFHNQFIALMNRVLPDIRPVPIPLDDTVHRVPFAVPFLPYVVPHGGKDALGWSQDGRWLVYYHPGDISDAWADGHSGVSPEIYNSCYQLGSNIINYSYSEHKKWRDARKKAR